MDKWQNKNAVVTGASSGIGLAISKELVKQKVNVIGLARRCEKFQSLMEEIGGNVTFYHCDVSDASSVEKAFQKIEKLQGVIDVLVNCAGIFKFITILNNDESVNSDLAATMNTNCMGAVYCTREAYKSMKKHDNHGCIININSVGGHYVPLPRPELVSLNTYAPSKHALTAVTEVLRHELTWNNASKIRVSSLSPGETRTDICDNETISGTASDYYKLNPSLDASEVAAGVVFILSLPYNVQVSELTMRCVGARV